MSKHAIYPFFLPHGGKKRVYVSGPMSGYPQDNAPAFEEATEALRAMGYSVCSPVETSTWLGELSHAQYLRFDFERVLEADFLVALPGWGQSYGALAELLVATRIDTKVWRWENFADYDRITYEQVVEAMSNHQSGTVEREWERDTTDPSQLDYGRAQVIKSLATLREEERAIQKNPPYDDLYDNAVRRSFDPC